MPRQGAELKPAVVLLQGDGPNVACASGGNWARDDARYRRIHCAGLGQVIETLENLGEESGPVALIVLSLERDPLAVFQYFRQISQTHPLALRAVIAPPGMRATAMAAVRVGDIDRVISADASAEEAGRAIGSLLDRYEALERLSLQAPGRLGRHIFITGATGFLGKCMVADLLRCGDARITVLCRGDRTSSYDNRLPFTAADFPGRLECVEGDVTLPRLGMTAEQWDRAVASVDEIWHLAAVTSFRETQRRQIMEVNVEGTRAMLAFAAACPRLNCFNHVSSAYVAGRRTWPEVVHEQLVAVPPSFNNVYEESKFLAERLVAESGLPHLVYRPSIIFGESYSGRSDGKTVYGVVRALLQAHRIAKRNNGHGNGSASAVRIVAETGATLNLLPLDWVVDSMISLRAQAEPDGTVFHVAHSQATTMGELHGAAMGALDIHEVRFDAQLASEKMTPLEAIFHRQAGPFVQYMLHADPAFDVTNTESILGANPYPELGPDFLRFALQSYAEMTDPPRERERSV
ncbi:MAG: SDR family oxidoreductase [FCB group bacterium]|jgi:nucleoside-diphosphate-sugar epimerase|nr:SDR family oxidoreductase [FCB group bacterium]